MSQKKIVEGQFTGTGVSASAAFYGPFNISLSGFGSATVWLERSFDQGATFEFVGDDPFTTNVQKIADSEEGGVLHRLNCINFSSGPIVYRMSQDNKPRR